MLAANTSRPRSSTGRYLYRSCQRFIRTSASNSCTRLLVEWESIKQLVDASRGLHVGRIKLATFPTVFTNLLPSFLKSFGQQYPGIDVVSLAGTGEEINAWLADSTVDVGVVMNAGAEREALMLARDAWVVTTPKTHPFARRSSGMGVSLDELAAAAGTVAGCSRRLGTRCPICASRCATGLRHLN
ncbi:MAG: hypothetical protein PPHEESC_6320 [uncultured Paraburkholderia sp.]|nr:MAG: hypothetical protein PPHEESC_6320 [uncultured Paraburkholderia sp.]CAH2946126.1 MAG: hypothetical protein PPHERAN_6368 [uncultured Paraburkholderia sp.]